MIEDKHVPHAEGVNWRKAGKRKAKKDRIIVFDEQATKKNKECYKIETDQLFQK